MKTLFNSIKYTLILTLSLNFISCVEQNSSETAKLPILPQPQEIKYNSGHITISKKTTIYINEGFEIASTFLLKQLKELVNYELTTEQDPKKADILFIQDTAITKEGYELEVNGQITIKASDPSGAFWAVQTLIQMLPVKKVEGDTKLSIPKVQIKDHPKFRYRGMHLDVGRHFFDKEFIKEYISYLSLLKMNYFHWHLTEDQGWRIEILQYPNLTNHGAYRDETLIGHYNDTPQRFDGKHYGGYYTQEDVKEIVAFAEAHNVTIIPEIELPGHAQAAISSYPELGCTGEPVSVATKWGVFENIYCPSETTFTFLKNVLSEVMELFPGEYIHIGGDEAPKIQWKKSQFCQELIQELGLQDEHELQSYFIKEIETFVNSKGKKIIGWDEILEGGLAPNATVMSWRGTQGAVEAAKEGHDVILTPTSHAYFDYYQADHMDEPLAIGGFLPLKKVYSFNPIPEELTEAESQFVLGAQGNIWTEYMPTTDQVEYMAFPRILAMSEVVWKGPSEDLDHDYPEFLKRLEKFYPRMDALDINYANHLYDVTGEVTKENDQVYYTLNTALPDKGIRYALNTDTLSNMYAGGIPLEGSSEIIAAVILDDGSLGRKHSAFINYHKGIHAEISLNVPPHQAYSAGGQDALINGVSGSDFRYGDKEWLGFWGDDLEITLQLPKSEKISTVSTRFYHAPGQWIHAPNDIELWAVMDGGIEAKMGCEISKVVKENLIEYKLTLPKSASLDWQHWQLKVPNFGLIPEGQQGAGNKAWTFMDEIIIE